MNPNERKVEIWHSAECRCEIDGTAIYVKEPCFVYGNHVTKKRIAQLMHVLKILQRKAP